MKPLPLFIQKAFRIKEKPQKQSLEYTLTDQVAAYIPLLELQDRRQLIQVEVIGNCHPQSYQSMIMGVDFVQRQLALDSLTPVNPFCPIIVGDRLIVTHQRQGQILSFSGKLTDICSDQSGLLYLMELPKDIAYKQRRFYPRLDFSDQQITAREAYVKLKSPLKTPWHCRLKNISAGGIRVSVPGKISPHLVVGKILPRADMVIEGIKVSCPLKVKSFRHQRRPFDHTSVSLEFSGLGFQDRLRLQNLISFYLEGADSKALHFAS